MDTQPSHFLSLPQYRVRRHSSLLRSVDIQKVLHCRLLEARFDVKVEAIAAINAAIEGVTNEGIIAFATNAIEAINETTTLHEIEIIKEQALAAIALAKSIYNSDLGEMGTPCTDCPAVDVRKGTTTIRLYSPDKVEFKKME